MRLPYLLMILFLPIALNLPAQEYGYTHYDIKEGLAGSVVYCMTQDKDGFIWFGTETGLSRFDGTHFKNFFKADGLPENQIIQLFADSKGRIWIAPFNQSVCYYYKGKIYNQQNDSTLRRIHINRFVVRFSEDNEGNILMQENLRLHLYQVNGHVVTFDKTGDRPIKNCLAIGKNEAGGFWVLDKDCIYELKNNRFFPKKNIYIESEHFAYAAFNGNDLIWRGDNSNEMFAGNFLSNQFIRLPFYNWHLNLVTLGNKNIAMCSSRGVWIYNLNEPDTAMHFLPNMHVSNVFKDSEGSIWCSTLGKGIYRLNSMVVQNLTIKENKMPSQQVSCFAQQGKSILIGAEIGNIIYRLNAVTGKQETPMMIFPTYVLDPIIAFQTLPEQKLIYASKHYLFQLNADYKFQKRVDYITIKGFASYKDKLLVATSKNVLLFDPDRFIITDTIWHERATTVFASNDTFYIGTLRGLYCQSPGKQPLFLGSAFPAFRSLVTGIIKDSNNVLWIATSGEGLIGYENGHIIAHIDQKKGLTSNNCRAIFLSGHTIWVGTDKGLNKTDLSKPGYPVQKYTTGDGLASDMINAVHVDGNNVFVGTPEGVTFFNDQKIERQSRCDLLITDITISAQSQQWDSSVMVIPHVNNNIRFDYVGISYKSAGDIRYRYRLLGLDSAWKETRETFLSYPTLPSGEYELQLQAINKFDIHSKLITARFAIESLIWEKIGFRILAGFIFLSMTGLLVWFIIQRIKKREREKTTINKRIGDLEQLARKAQMNPHFIFNSLNSIQQYVMDSDLAGANKFISGFSRLIRQTLDFSSRKEISLEEELDYLTNYLELEKSRLEDAFSWQVIMENTINPTDYYLPPMILQPYVENSIRHGLRYRKDRQGKLLISIKKENAELVCIMEDNGIGRKAAQKFKSSSHIEYQSKGMSLTAERIAMLNKDSTEKITMQIEDLEDAQRHALGTRVTLRFPVT